MNEDFGRRFDLARKRSEPYTIESLNEEARKVVPVPDFSDLDKAISEFSLAQARAKAAVNAYTIARDNTKAEISKLRGEHLLPSKRSRV